MLRDPTLEELSGLTALISGAALDPGLWRDFVDELHKVADGVATHILAYDSCGLETGFIASGYDPARLETYAGHFHSQNVWAPGFLKFGLGEVVDSRDMASDEVLFASAFYHDWVKPQDDIRLGGGVTLARSEAGTFLLGGNIPGRMGDEASARWLRLVRLLTPHLINSWETARALTRARLDPDAALVVITDTSGRIVFADDPGDHLSRDDAEMRVSLRGTLQIRDAAAQGLYQSLCSGIERRGSLGTTRRMSLGDHRLSLSALNVDAIEATWPVDVFAQTGPCVAVVLTKETRTPDRAANLSQRFGLSSSEAEVALALSGGLSLRQISEARGVSIHTIRNQVKSAMGKCDVRRQSQLVALVLRDE